MEQIWEFVWNLMIMDFVKYMNVIVVYVVFEVDEFEFVGFMVVFGKFVNVFRVGESLVVFECKVFDIVCFKGVDGKQVDVWLILGEVVVVYIDKVMIKDGVYQIVVVCLIVCVGWCGDYFEIKLENMFEMVCLDQVKLI